MLTPFMNDDEMSTSREVDCAEPTSTGCAGSVRSQTDTTPRLSPVNRRVPAAFATAAEIQFSPAGAEPTSEGCRQSAMSQTVSRPLAAVVTSCLRSGRKVAWSTFPAASGNGVASPVRACRSSTRCSEVRVSSSESGPVAKPVIFGSTGTLPR